MPGALTLNDRLPERSSAPIATPEVDKPGFLDGIASSFRVARADTTGYVEGAQLDAYSPIIQSLQDLGYKPENFVNIGTGTVTPGAVWHAVQAERAKGHFAELPDTVEEFETQWRTRERQSIERDSQRAQRAGLLPRLLGGVGGAMTDPVNIYTLPFGGFGGTLAKRLLTEAAANMAIEGALMPVAQRNREKLDREAMTGTEVLANIAFAGIGAAALRGAGEGVVHHWDVIKAAPQAVQERAWGAILERTPGLRDKLGKTLDWDALDDHLPDIAEAMVGRENLTPEQRVAVDGLRAEGRFARSNPFADDAAGRAAQMDGMALAMKRIMDGAPALPVPRSAALAPSARLRDSTAIATRTVDGDAFTTLKRRIGVVESGGSDSAKNPRSSATGRYQFIGKTWLRLYRNRYGSNGLSDRQVLAKRTDGRLQEVLMDDLLQHNADALEASGIPVDAGNLYLAHFAGSAGAKALHRASPGASARSVLGDAVVRANPFLEKMNAREVIDWAARKMGGGGERAPVRSGEPDGGASARIEAELDQLRSEREALLQDAGVPVREDIGTEDAPLPVEEIADDIPAVREELLPQDTLDEAVRDALPGLRAVVADKSRSINAIDDIADELALDPAQVRRGLTELALRGEVVMNVPRNTRERIRAANGRFRDESDAELLARTGGTWEGNFMRRPPAPVRSADTLAEWISEQGGLKDDGGDLTAMGGGEWHKAKPFRRSLVAREGEGMAPDEALERAIEQGFFPELEGVPQDTYADLHDVALLFDALGAELAGKPRQRGDLLADETAGPHFDADHPDYQPILSFVQDELQQLGLDPYEVPSEWVEDLAAEVFHRPAGMNEADAVFYGLHAMAERNAGEAFAETGELDYEPIGYDEFARILDDADYRAAAEAGQRQQAADELAREGGADGGRAGEGAGAPEPLESGPLEAARYADYDNPTGEATKAQKDSLLHDMRARRDYLALAEVEDVREFQLPRQQKGWQGVPDAGVQVAFIPSVGKWTYSYDLNFRDGGLARPFTPRDIYDTPEDAQRKALEVLSTHAAHSYDDSDVAKNIKNRIRKWATDERKALGPYSWMEDSPPPAIATNAGDGPPTLDKGAAVDPAIASRQAEEARLLAEAPMRGENKTGEAQDGTVGLGLFDAADQPQFRLDTEGEPQSLPDLIADIEADEAELGAIRDCLL